ncbi:MULTISPECIES: TfpX/TfpZ family type IV pilin accessory protein [Acinetobacter]|uniref:TfpX/TfpZ family type IV pilin accessory protein n=1 Tax=Acinetobacter TaxID=469 RepID=UPI0015D3B73C|nr:MULTISPECIES: TfpX/TfpZ family type IV pilin accessory protein [Acinetobacter]MCL6232260.1 type IV pilin accessory protein [Acinetobacter amyesii]
MENSKRVQFFKLHFLISFLCALLILYFINFIWYPAPLAIEEGVGTIAIMIITIDIIIGPMLTLLVYKDGKKSLKTDLSIIIFIQILAIGYGLFSVASSRPVWIAQNGSIFQLVRANAILPKDQEMAGKLYEKNGWGKPQWVSVNDHHPRYEYYAEQTLVPNLYTDLDIAVPRIQKYAQSLESLYTFNKAKEVDRELKKFPLANSWMPLRTTGLGLVVLLDKQNGSIIGISNLRPWK